jgi:threonine/homoserine/homoserine lactone efflux protein
VIFLEGGWLGLGAAAQPGPFQAYLLGQAAREGPARALPLALVPLASDAPIVATTLAVLTQLPLGAVRALQVGGGAFVAWLGASALRGAIRPRPAAAGAAGAPAHPAPRGFWRATVVNLTNPNAWTFWAGVGGPTLARAWRADPAEALLFLAGFYGLLLGGNAALVLAFGGAGRLGPGASRALGALSGAALVAFGAWQVGRGVLAA